ncbi:hypothetical protein HDU88_007337 [Geranomyces variabilis]|nr:hypothetical protein HDU88_007337 [Geranomyces variabilis]
MTSVAAITAPPLGASAPSRSPSPSPGRRCTATSSSSALGKQQQQQQRPTRRQLSRERSAISIRHNVVAAAHAVYVAGHNAKERVKHALPIIARRNTGDSISSSSSARSSSGGGSVYLYPNNALSDTEEERPNSWPRITPRAPRIGDATDPAQSLSSSFSMSECSINNNSRSRRLRVSTRDIRKFIKSFPPTTTTTLSSVDETLEAAYPCALARSHDNTLWHGQLFLTTHRLLFAVSAAAAEQQFKNVEVDYTDVVSVEKTVTGAIWPNALKVIVSGSGSGETRKELLFAAFVGRDAAFCDLMILRRNRRISVEEEQRSGAAAAGKRPLRVTFKVDEPADGPAVLHRSGGVAAVVHDNEARDPYAEAPPPPLPRRISNDDDTSSSFFSGTPSPSPVSLALANAYTRNPTTSAKPNPSTPLIPTAPPPSPAAAAQPSSPVATLKHIFLLLLPPRNLLPNLSLPTPLFSPTRDQLALATILFSLAIILLFGLVTAAVNVSRLAALTQRIDRAAALASAAAAAAAAAGGGGRVS